MNDVGNFFIEFTTKGLNELKDGMKDLDKKMDALNKQFKSGTNSGDAFFGKFTGWIKKAGLLAAAMAGVAKAIHDAFSVGDDIIHLNVMAEMAGVKSEDIEALAIATSPYAGKKDIDAAGKYYRNMLETQTEWWRGKYSQDVIDVMSRAGVTGLRPDSSPQEWTNGLVTALSFYKGKNDRYSLGSRNLLAEAFGLTDAQILLFQSGQEKFNNMMNYGKNHITLSGEENFRSAMELEKSEMEFKEAWQKLVIELMPLARVMMEALTIVVELLRPIATAVGNIAHWLAEKLQKPVEYTRAMADGEITSTDATVSLAEEMKEASQDMTIPHWRRRLSAAVAALSDFLVEKVAERNGKTVEETMDAAHKNLNAAAAAGKLPSSSLTQDNKVTVNVDTIKVETTDKNTTGRDIVDGLNNNINRLNINPATLNVAVKGG